MAKKTVYLCDVCGAEKKETNHWWGVIIHQTELGMEHLSIYKFEDAPEYAPVACGDRCVITLVQRFLSTGQLEPIVLCKGE